MNATMNSEHREVVTILPGDSENAFDIWHNGQVINTCYSRENAAHWANAEGYTVDTPVVNKVN